jgi:hypothetical protein
MGIPGFIPLLLFSSLPLQGPLVLNPRTYRSSSGAFELEVDPTDRRGRGPGRYRLERHGGVVWQGTLPFTFFDAAVAEDGAVAGVAYSKGFEGGPYGEDPGNLRIAVLDPDGKLRFQQVMPRRETRVIHGEPVPQSKGVLLDEVGGRALVRLAADDSGREDWQLYDLRSGAASGRFAPGSLDDGHLLDVRRLTQGSGFLAHWSFAGASRFKILTRDFEPVWSHEILGAGSIDAVTKPGFTLESEKELIDFVVSSRDSRVLVTESGRRASVRPDPLRTVPEWDLSLLGRIELGPDSKNRRPVRSVHHFDIDGLGRLALVRCESGASSLVMVEPTGNVLADIALELPSCAMTAWIGGDLWAVVERNGEGEFAAIHAVDVGRKTTRPLARLEGSYLSSVRGNGGRGFLILHGLTDVLRLVDASGIEVTRLRRDSNDPEALFSPEDMVGTADGKLAVLDNIRSVIQVFRSDGSFVESIDLGSALGRKASYPAEVAVSPRGGFAVWDFGAPRPLLLLEESGALLSEISPRYDDGRSTGNLRHLRYAPDGALWATDGEALLRLNDQGVVDAVVGARPIKTQLTEIIATARDGAGRYYLLDRRTASTHVFDASGAFSHQCDPQPGDFDQHLSSPQLTVNGDGTVHVSDGDRDRYVVFDAGGRRVGTLPKRLDDIREDWYAQPKGLDRWITKMEDLYLTDAEGRLLHRLSRHGDRTWIVHPSSAAVASDGSIAILSSYRGENGQGATLGVFSPDGTAVRTRRFPGLESFASLAYDAERTALGIDHRILLLEGDEPIGSFTPRGYDSSYWDLFLSGGGRELHLLDRARRVVYRYDLSAR